MSSENLELKKIHSKQDKIREYEDILLSNVDIDPKKEKMEEKITDLKDLLDDKTIEIISNEDGIPSDEEIAREDEEMNELIENDKVELNNEVKELANEVEGFSLENSSLFNMINITQEDIFILILLILALFLEKK